MLFCSRYPALVNAAGHPLSWRQYVGGMSHLSRQRARDTLDTYRAFAAGNSYGPERARWVEEQEGFAGWG